MSLSAVVQSSSPPDPEADPAQARLVERAASYGPQLIATPENTNFLGPPAEKVRTAEALLGPTCRRFAALAGRTGIDLVLGPFHERSDELARCHNTTVLFGPSGSTQAAYRKPGRALPTWCRSPGFAAASRHRPIRATLRGAREPAGR
jgi:predicted amidohydrolase